MEARAVCGVDERWWRDKRQRRCNKRQRNNQLTGQMRGEREVEALVDKRWQDEEIASVDGVRLACDGQQQQE